MKSEVGVSTPVATVQKTVVITGHCGLFTLTVEGPRVRLDKGSGDTLYLSLEELSLLQLLIQEVSREMAEP